MTKLFGRAVKRAVKLNAELATGGGDEQAAMRAVDRLYDLVNEPEIRGLPEAERNGFHARVSELHRARVAASETGRAARVAAREEEMRVVREALRAARL